MNQLPESLIQARAAVQQAALIISIAAQLQQLTQAVNSLAEDLHRSASLNARYEERYKRIISMIKANPSQDQVMLQLIEELDKEV